MEMISRRAYGFRNFENYRIRVMTHCGWDGIINRTRWMLIPRLWGRAYKLLILGEELVGVRGFEPPTPDTPWQCATRLRYTPTERAAKCTHILSDCNGYAIQLSGFCSGCRKFHQSTDFTFNKAIINIRYSVLVMVLNTASRTSLNASKTWSLETSLHIMAKDSSNSGYLAK